jgi:hypothetical protein
MKLITVFFNLFLLYFISTYAPYVAAQGIVAPEHRGMFFICPGGEINFTSVVNNQARVDRVTYDSSWVYFIKNDKSNKVLFANAKNIDINFSGLVLSIFHWDNIKDAPVRAFIYGFDKLKLQSFRGNDRNLFLTKLLLGLSVSNNDDLKMNSYAYSSGFSINKAVTNLSGYTAASSGGPHFNMKKTSDDSNLFLMIGSPAKEHNNHMFLNYLKKETTTQVRAVEYSDSTKVEDSSRYKRHLLNVETVFNCKDKKLEANDLHEIIKTSKNQYGEELQEFFLLFIRKEFLLTSPVAK